MKKVLVLGANGFIGKHLCITLSENKYEVIKIDRDNFDELAKAVEQADFVMHVAGINRVKDDLEYEENVTLAQSLVDEMIKVDKKCPIIFASSRKALEKTPYGKSKLAAEKILEQFARKNKSLLYIYRLDNVFGPGAKPNYNSVVATFCNQIINHREIQIDDMNKELTLVYIDDVVEEFASQVMLSDDNKETEGVKFLDISTKEKITLQEIARLLVDFEYCRENFIIPDLSNKFVRRMNATYMSYLDNYNIGNYLEGHYDERGIFYEFLHSHQAGQISINVIKKGKAKGNHYHFTKFEKFLVIKGTVRIDFERDGKEFSYEYSGDKLRVIEIPPLTRHTIINIGEEDAYIIMWASEMFDESNDDTHRKE